MLLCLLLKGKMKSPLWNEGCGYMTSTSGEQNTVSSYSQCLPKYIIFKSYFHIHRIYMHFSNGITSGLSSVMMYEASCKPETRFPFSSWEIKTNTFLFSQVLQVLQLNSMLSSSISLQFLAESFKGVLPMTSVLYCTCNHTQQWCQAGSLLNVVTTFCNRSTAWIYISKFTKVDFFTLTLLYLH